MSRVGCMMAMAMAGAARVVL
ncbi:hypothetical protein TIFTF001_014590, partial [Ficus carica]